VPRRAPNLDALTIPPNATTRAVLLLSSVATMKFGWLVVHRIATRTTARITSRDPLAFAKMTAGPVANVQRVALLAMATLVFPKINALLPSMTTDMVVGKPGTLKKFWLVILRHFMRLQARCGVGFELLFECQ